MKCASVAARRELHYGGKTITQPYPQYLYKIPETADEVEKFIHHKLVSP